MFLFRLKNYLKYRSKAVGSHALHSPFLFDLYKQVIKPSKKFRYENVEKLRNELRNDHRVIDLFDLKTQINYRKTISSIAKTSLSQSRFSAFLNLLIDFLQISRVLETGTSLGINTLYMAGSESVERVSTIEASPIISSIAKEQFAKLLQHKIEITTGTIQDVFESVVVRDCPQLCFIDADHRSEAVRFCIDTLMTHVPEIKCIIVHDIYWSEDMLDSWQQMVSDDRFPLTVDLFQAGLIFPNLEMPKQHFTLRF